ncbi:hypothetical protein LCGC14_0645320 [marine sediment metagenome]|uniref:Sugar O-methyltransferase n=1 Tax=marine sediment metagenome TaxID=412755 RepID=A0A0F9TJM1_9ZZZZ
MIDYLAELKKTAKRYKKNDTMIDAWNDIIRKLAYCILIDDVKNFLDWQPMRRAVFVADASHIARKLKFLKQSKQWRRWKYAIKESSLINVPRMSHYPESSGSSVNLAYHLAQFEHKFGYKYSLLQADEIFEFGGGYGNMCRILYRLGFKGKYILYDVPLMSALQRYVLDQLTLPIDEEIICVSSWVYLMRELAAFKHQNSAFIATMSFSEVPVDHRIKFVQILDSVQIFLIAYKDDFYGMNNHKYFDSLYYQYKNKFRIERWLIEKNTDKYYFAGVRNGYGD